ncbi:MAG: hypothetical protein EA394_03085 [Bacteroidia bacterium]|nr:MAG: hypothetical protein EA394_03085 [Bacteroidia bacterium]
METGICLISAAAVRLEAHHKSEMVSQLLFGERFHVIESGNEWLYIESLEDVYRGWIWRPQVEILDKKNKMLLQAYNSYVITESFSRMSMASGERSFMVGAGSTMYGAPGQGFTLFGKTFMFEGEYKYFPKVSSGEDLAKLATIFLHTPYLWGGRSVFGIDCSGLVQIVCKIAGIAMPRDASVQATKGKTIHLIHEAKAGDLCFFASEEKEISHTGVLLDNEQIIHAYGRVRIDNIDHHGIFNTDTRKYSHTLRLIRRII